jgi:RHS repeat-associated protein
VAGVTRTYAYDPLDRLVTISEGGTEVVRIRYAGQSGSIVQLLDNAWAVTRSIAVDAAGSALADWAPGGTGWRRYLTNGHGDLVAAAAADGTISASLRLDPWGVPLRAVPAGYPAFGFQGSLTDRTTTLVYARARWYDPVLATFTSEDPYPGELADPATATPTAPGTPSTGRIRRGSSGIRSAFMTRGDVLRRSSECPASGSWPVTLDGQLPRFE